MPRPQGGPPGHATSPPSHPREPSAYVAVAPGLRATQSAEVVLPDLGALPFSTRRARPRKSRPARRGADPSDPRLDRVAAGKCLGGPEVCSGPPRQPVPRSPLPASELLRISADVSGAEPSVAISRYATVHGAARKPCGDLTFALELAPLAEPAVPLSRSPEAPVPRRNGPRRRRGGGRTRHRTARYTPG